MIATATKLYQQVVNLYIILVLSEENAPAFTCPFHPVLALQAEGSSNKMTQATRGIETAVGAGMAPEGLLQPHCRR